MKIKITIYLDESSTEELAKLKANTIEVFKNTMSACIADEISERQFNRAIKRLNKRMEKKR
jgi:hypothetical protein